MRPQAAYAMVVVERTRVVRSHRYHPAFPAQWFTAYIALSPATGLFCHRRPWSCLHELDTSVGVSGPHRFTVRVRRPRLKAPSASTASRPAFRDVAQRPSVGRDGGEYRGDLGLRKSRIFLRRGLDTGFEKQPDEQISWPFQPNSSLILRSALLRASRRMATGTIVRDAAKRPLLRMRTSLVNLLPHHDEEDFLAGGSADDFLVEHRRRRRQLRPHQRRIERGIETAMGVADIGVIGDAPAQVENAVRLDDVEQAPHRRRNLRL